MVLLEVWGGREKKIRTEKGVTHILEKEKITTETDRREKEGCTDYALGAIQRIISVLYLDNDE